MSVQDLKGQFDSKSETFDSDNIPFASEVKEVSTRIWCTAKKVTALCVPQMVLQKKKSMSQTEFGKFEAKALGNPSRDGLRET